jgi:hypothetical protein
MMGINRQLLVLSICKILVDHSEFIHAHFACANWMSKARRGKPRKFPDFLDRRLEAGNDFGLAQTIRGTLIPELTRGFDGTHDRRKITIRTEIVAIDHGGILKVVAGQTDGASARRLHQSRQRISANRSF